MQIEKAERLFIESRLASNCRTGTVENYKRTTSRFRRLTRLITTDEITPEVVRAYLAKLQQKTPPLKGSTLKLERSRLLTWLYRLSDEGIMPEVNWQRRIARIRYEQRESRHLTAEDVARFIATAKTMTHRMNIVGVREVAMVYLLLDSGLRVGEIINLRRDQVDIVGMCLIVDSRCKSRKERRLPFGIETQRQLRKYIKLRGNHPSPYFWVTRDSYQLSRSLVLQAIKRISRAAGLGDICTHTLRHTCATLLFEHGMTIDHVQRIMGHSRRETTARLYVHIDEAKTIEQYRQACPMDNISP